MDKEKILKIINSSLDSDYQSMLDSILATLDEEVWDNIKEGDPRARNPKIREEFRLKSEKWKATRFFVKRIQSGLCARCGESIDKFHLHHKDQTLHYFDLKLNNLEAVHKDCHEKGHGSDYEEVYKTIPTEKINMNTQVKTKTTQRNKFVSLVRFLKDKKVGDKITMAALIVDSGMDRTTVGRVFLGVLKALNFLKKEGRGCYVILEKFKKLQQKSDGEITKLHECFMKDVARDIDTAKKLNLTVSKTEIKFRDRAKHPLLISFMEQLFSDSAQPPTNSSLPVPLPIAQSLQTVDNKKKISNVSDIASLINQVESSDLKKFIIKEFINKI